MTYSDGVLYAPTGPHKTVVALNAANGSLLWESPVIANGTAFRVSSPPMIWNDYVIVGSALGDDPPFTVPAHGSVTALDITNGSIVWQNSTAVGPWVEGANATKQGGATTWSGGAIDNANGIAYLPCGNPAPDFTAESRVGPTPYANYMIAVDLTNGVITWATPFIAEGTVLPNVTLPDTHDWDTAWGSNLVTAGGTQMVIGHNKRGDVMAMDAATGSPIWWTNVAHTYRVEAQAAENGSGEVWPGPGHGVESYSAVDNSTVYLAASSMGMNYFLGHVDPVFDSIENGIGNGSITALDLTTGEVKWKVPTDFPTWTSPLVTNGVVFSGHITATGKPYSYGPFGYASNTPLMPSGVLMALNAENGSTLWQADVGAPIGIGGPSIGHGMLIVPTGGIQTPNKGGYVVAFGLPSGNVTPTSKTLIAINNVTNISNVANNIGMSWTNTSNVSATNASGTILTRINTSRLNASNLSGMSQTTTNTSASNATTTTNTSIANQTMTNTSMSNTTTTTM
jgi:alcohol dehydrogenase (cytochrome c)